MQSSIFAAIILASASLAGCATQTTAQSLSAEDQAALDARKQNVLGALSAYSGDYDVSPAAMATAVLGADGKPVGLLAYASPVDAVKAGDIAAFIASIQTAALREGDSSFAAVISSIDAAAADDPERALSLVEPAVESDDMSIMGGFLKAWYLAMNGQYDEAVDAHRDVSPSLPGLTGDLSLAALLEGARF